MTRYSLAVILVSVGLLHAEDRTGIITDVPLERVAEGKITIGDASLHRHYEGLKQFARGKQMELQERIPEALQAYQMAMQFDGKATDLIRHMLPLCTKMQQTASTLRLIRRSLGIDIQQPDLWMRYAQELHDLERHDEVLKVTEQAFKQVQLQEHPAFAAELHVMRASSLEAKKQYQLAIQSYQNALNLVQDRNRFLEDPFSPTQLELPIEEAKLLERLGRACMKAKDGDAALAALKKSHVLHPRGEDRLELNLAEVYLAIDKPEVAIAHLEKAVEQKPTSDEAYRLMVEAYQKSGRGEEVVAMLQKLHLGAPQHTTINLVLAEQLTEQKNYALAELLYREIFTVEQVPFKEAVLGYYKLLTAQGKHSEALMEFDQVLHQPARRGWARAAMAALISDTALLKSLAAQHEKTSIQHDTRFLLVKLCVQAELWSDAEALGRVHLKHEPKPQELYLLLAKCLLEQNRLSDLLAVCDDAIKHPAVTSPLVFHLEMAKAQARLGNSAACEQSLQSARELCGPRSTDEYKQQCTVLYTMHLLHQNDACIQLSRELLGTMLANGPWGRQVRYVLAHALEAHRDYDKAIEQYDIIVKNDFNDSEAQAAQARCLLFQNKDLERAEAVIRSAIEIDIIDQQKRIRMGQQLARLSPHPEYQATLGAILLRHGKTQEGFDVLVEIARHLRKPNPWIALAVGDGYLAMKYHDLAQQCWKQALTMLPGSATMGTDLRESLEARIRQTQAAIVPATATTSSPGRP